MGDGPNSKAKHPNQYTYRPKPPSSSQAAVPAAASPARRGAGGTPAPPSIAPPQHEHGTRRAGAIAHGAIANPTLSATSVANLNWYLPDHLTAYTDLLPTPQPNALDVRSQRTLPHISRNHHMNQRYGPFSNERDENGRLVLPEEIPIREPAGEAETHPEPPARVRYPPKRITVGEIRKRVRNMLDYVSKAQSGEEKRLERNRVLGIVVTPLPNKGKGKEKADQNEEQVNGDSMDVEEPSGSGFDANVLGDIDMNQLEDQADEPAPRERTAAEMMEEFTRDLIAFQETYLSNTSATPLPPPTSNFEPSLPVPGMDVEADSRAVSEAEAEADPEPEVEPESGLQTDVVPETTAEVSGEAIAQETEAEADERQMQHDGLEALVSEEVRMILDDREPVEEPVSESELPLEPVSVIDANDQDQGEITDIPASSFEIPLPEATPTQAEVEATPVLARSLEPEVVTTNGNLTPMLINTDEVNMGIFEGLDVYREGQVDVVEISGQEEMGVVENQDQQQMTPEVTLLKEQGEDLTVSEPLQLEPVDVEPVVAEAEVRVEEVKEQPKEVTPETQVNGDQAVTTAVVEAVV